MKSKEQSNISIVNSVQDLPKEKLEKYIARISDGEQFNIEINEEVKQVINKVLSIKEKLQLWLWNELTDEGYLTHAIKDYYRCFPSIDKNKLDGLLGKDLQKWKDKQDKIQKHETEKIEEIKN